MPAGVYRRIGTDPASPPARERFRCAAGPSGWRYTSEVTAEDPVAVLASLDLVLDTKGRQLRVAVGVGESVLRGGLTDVGLTWLRDGAEQHDKAALGFTSASPGFLVSTARLLNLPVGQRRRVRLVALAEDTLAATSLEQGWVHLSAEEHPTDLGPLWVSVYEVADLATGERSQLHLAGDVLLSAPGIELVDLDGPPTR